MSIPLPFPTLRREFALCGVVEPLFTDTFLAAMAVTITFGLLFATVFTMIVVPVLYAIFFRVDAPEKS